MSNNEENIKIKLSLDNLFSKTEKQTDPSDIPPVSVPVSKLSSIGNQEGLGIKVKSSEAKLPELEEKNIPLQDVKLKNSPLKVVNVIADKKDSLPQPSKSNEQIISSAKIPDEREGVKLSLNFSDAQKEGNKANFGDFKILSSTNGEGHIPDSVKLKPKTISPLTFSSLTAEESTSIEENSDSEAHDSIGNVAYSSVNLAKKSTKYLYIVGALAVTIMILLYFLISSIITLMTI